MYIDESTADGDDVEIPLLMVLPGDTVVLQDKDESDRRTRYLVTTATWMGDHLDIGISWVLTGVGGSAPTGQRALLHVFRSGGLTQATADARYVNVDGDAMVGSLLVQTPTLPGHATNLQYVDARTPKILVGTIAPSDLTAVWIDTN